MNKFTRGIFLFSFLLLSACSGDGGTIYTACTAEACSGIVIEFIDKKTGFHISSCEHSVTFTDGVLYST